jgi:prophage regulatory protein|tara:strand:+ start:1858 stop:2094 length:237 start_codon:yes stop_codon:yes gene_type:complete
MLDLKYNPLPNRNETRLIRIDEVKSLSGLSRSYIYALAADGVFPKSVPLVPGGAARAWVYSEVQEFIDQRIAERDGEL